MCKSFFVILLLAVLGVVSSGFLSDGVKSFHFMKAGDGSEEYDFEYELDGGKIFRGRTFILNLPKSHLYVMFGANDTLYWVEFTEDEYNNDKSLSKVVRLIERSYDEIMFRDDFIRYELIISKGSMWKSPYQTLWDLERICFMLIKNEQQTLFRYLIKAKNNSRRYNGTTFYEADDPHVQHIHLDNGNQHADVYQVQFTDDELHSPDTFCKGISKTISCCFDSIFPDYNFNFHNVLVGFIGSGGNLEPEYFRDINPNLLISLVSGLMYIQKRWLQHEDNHKMQN